jgi:hypothetical protein
MSDGPFSPLPYPGLASPALPASSSLEARVEEAEVEPGFVEVDPRFAARLTTAHDRWLELEAHETPHGAETLTRDLPNVGEQALQHLDERGVARVGSPVRPGTILVGMVSPRGAAPLTPEEKLLRAIFGEAMGDMVDRSLRSPACCSGEVAAVEVDAGHARVRVSWTRPLEVGDMLELDGQLTVVSAIRPLSADLACRGGPSRVLVRKHSPARDALEARCIGPYDPATHQPAEGRDVWGGQRIGVELAAALSARAPWTAWELFTIKSDSVTGRTRAHESLVKQENPGHDYLAAPDPGAPAPPGAGGIFDFFEKPKRDEQPEGVTQLVACLRALGLGLCIEPGRVSAEVLPGKRLRDEAHGRVERGGLLSQKIFGPLRDYECECGKYKRMKHRGIVCEACGVEVVQSKVRRQRCGFIELAAPCPSPLTGDPLDVIAVLPAGLREGESPLADAYEDVLAARDAARTRQAVERLFALLRDQVNALWRERVLDKAVDYSGRAHLTVDPSLTAGTCRAPRAMLAELFRPLIYGVLEAHGFVTTIKSAKRMVDAGRPEAIRAAEAVSAGYPLLLASGARVVCRTPLPWDAPAIAVDAETVRKLKDRRVAVHLPITTQAALECSTLDLELAAHSPMPRSGWLSAARDASDFVAHVLDAARQGSRDTPADPLLRSALGHPPPPPDPAALDALEAEWRQRRSSFSLQDEAAAGPARPPEAVSRPLEELELSVATANALAKLGFVTVGDLCRRTESDLLRTKGFGRKQLREVKELLAELGLSLGMRV